MEDKGEGGLEDDALGTRLKQLGGSIIPWLETTGEERYLGRREVMGCLRLAGFLRYLWAHQVEASSGLLDKKVW